MSTSKSPSNKVFPILPVAQKYIKTTMKGSGHWAVCPFHQDTSPSLSISVEKNIFKCFSCNIGGDAVSFVMRIEKCNYVTAIKKIAGILNLNPNDYLSAQENHNQKILKINEIACNAYHKCLFNPRYKEHLDYLTEERGLSIETIRKYKIGYAPEEDILENILRLYLENTPDEKWGEEEIRKTKIFRYRKDGCKDAYFKERIIFPVFDIDGQVIAFSGRNIRKDGPKYLNIKTNEVFAKKHSIFNIQSLQAMQPIYIFEGFIDLLSCEQKGFKNGIACMGGTIDAGIFGEIKKFSSEIYLCLDNDESGDNFIINLSRSLIQDGFKIKVVNLLESSYKDIDEFMKGDMEKAMEALSTPICFFEWYYIRENRRNNLSNLASFQIFLKASLDILFTEVNQEIYLRSNIDISYAKELVRTLFDFYKKLDTYESNGYIELVEKKLQEYDRIISRSVIAGPKLDRQEPPEKISSHTDYHRITNPFVRKAIRYQSLISYAHNNREAILEERNWCWEIPEKYAPEAQETKLIFEFLRDIGSNLEIPEKYRETWNFLQQYRDHAEPIREIDDFFNRYYSFHQEYIQDLLMLLKSEKLPIEERWKKNRELKDIYDAIASKASSFFFSSKFSRKK